MKGENEGTQSVKKGKEMQIRGKIAKLYNPK